MIFVNKTVLLA